MAETAALGLHAEQKLGRLMESHRERVTWHRQHLLQVAEASTAFGGTE
jgi:hypothetical protein